MDLPKSCHLSARASCPRQSSKKISKMSSKTKTKTLTTYRSYLRQRSWNSRRTKVSQRSIKKIVKNMLEISRKRKNKPETPWPQSHDKTTPERKPIVSYKLTALWCSHPLRFCSPKSSSTFYVRPHLSWWD